MVNECIKCNIIFKTNQQLERHISKKNKCEIEYEKGDKDQTNKKLEDITCIPLTVIVTKTNVKDIDQLKAKTECKTKKTKIIYDYKKLFQNVTRHIGLGYFGGTKTLMSPKTSKFTRTTKNKSRKRRLKSKGYK